MTVVFSTTPVKSPGRDGHADLYQDDPTAPASNDSSYIAVLPFQDCPPRKRHMALLTIGELLKDMGSAEPKHKSKWEEFKVGVRGAAGRKKSGPKYLHCQMTLSTCPGCVFCYCLLYQPVAYTPNFFADNTYWFPADFVQSFFMLCHHHTHDQHKFKILYLPVPQKESESSDSNQASSTVRLIPSLYDLKKHTTTLIHVILRGSHFVVIVVDLPSRLIEVVDGFWDPNTSAALIKRSRLYKAINSLMQNVSIFPQDGEIIWEMGLDKKYYTVSYGTNLKWTVKYKSVPPQIDDSSCGPRACSVAASIFFPNDTRSHRDLTGWSRQDIINRYKGLIRQHENDPCIGLSIRVKSDVVLGEHASSHTGRPKTPEDTKVAKKEPMNSGLLAHDEDNVPVNCDKESAAPPCAAGVDVTNSTPIGLPTPTPSDGPTVPIYTLQDANGRVSTDSAIPLIYRQFLDPAHKQEFLSEVTQFLNEGMPDNYVLTNVFGDGNCLMYSAMMFLKRAKLLSLLFPAKKKGGRPTTPPDISRDILVPQIRRLIQAAAYKRSIPDANIFQGAAIKKLGIDEFTAMYKNLTVTEITYEEEVESFFSEGVHYTNGSQEAKDLSVTDTVFLRYFAYLFQLDVVVHELYFDMRNLIADWSAPVDEDQIPHGSSWATRIFHKDGTAEVLHQGYSTFHVVDPVAYPHQLIFYTTDPITLVRHYVPIHSFGVCSPPPKISANTVERNKAQQQTIKRRVRKSDLPLILEDSSVQAALEEHLTLPVTQHPTRTGQPTIAPSKPPALCVSSSTRAATAQTTSNYKKEDLHGEITNQPTTVVLSSPTTVFPVITLPPNVSIPYKVDASFYLKYLSRYTTVYKDHMAQSGAGPPPPKAFCPMLNRKPSSCLCMFFNEDRSLSFSYFMAQYLSLFFNSPNDQARCQFFFESICYSSNNKTLMVDLSCTECPASISVWRSDFCANATRILHSQDTKGKQSTHLVCITQLERAIYVALSSSPDKAANWMPPRAWKPVIPAHVKHASTNILNISVRRNNSRMLLYAYSKVLVSEDDAFPFTHHAFRLALTECAAMFPAAKYYCNSPLVDHPRPWQTYKRNYGMGNVHLAVPPEKQTGRTTNLFNSIHAVAYRLPDSCVECLELIGTTLPNKSSFHSGVDGIRYIGLDGPDLHAGLATCTTKSIKSMYKKHGNMMRSCSTDISQCFLSCINGLRLDAGSPALTTVPAMKPAIIITCKESQCQVPHMDIKEDELRANSYIGFIPLSKNGMYLEVWPLDDLNTATQQVTGELVFVPLGMLLLVPAATLHAGGMKAPLPSFVAEVSTGHNDNTIRQHPRLHFYLFPTRDDAEYTTCNLYEMPLEMQNQLATDKKRFSDIFIHSPQLQFTPDAPGELAFGLLNDVSPIFAERTRSQK